jgi:hypothetical protein
MRLLIASIFAMFLTGCASSGFSVATQANTNRASEFQDNILLQAVNDLTAINDCYVENGDRSVCTVMATALRTQSNMMTMFAPFVATSLFSRVPAAPEEIMKSLAEFGIKASLMKFGIEQVSNVITTGQYAAYQTAQAATQQSGEIVNKVLDKPATILTIPEGGSASLLK